jgi:hypothetical protein
VASPRRAPGVPVRFFNYISDAKVDMLLPQIPAGKKQSIAAELGFNVALLSGNIRAQATTLDSLVARLLAVEKYIRNNESMGPPSDPHTRDSATRNISPSPTAQATRAVGTVG